MPARRRGSSRAAGEGRASGELALVLAGRAWIRDKLQPIELGIDEDGHISRIGKDLKGAERRDYGDHVLVPSATDLHVHLRDPGGPETAETLPTGTAAAAHGGVGLVVDMPNTVPPVTTAERLIAKSERAHGRLAVDLVLYAALERASRVASLGRVAGGFKLYLSPTTGIEPPPEEEPVPKLLRAVAATGLPLSVHAEDPAKFDGALIARTTPDWDARRPPDSELSAVETLIRAAPPSLRLHVAHVTTEPSLERLRAVGHSFEVTPHHLLLPARLGQGTRFKVNPPLRSPSGQAGLWQRFVTGHVPIVASDHAPHPVEEKDKPFIDAPSGMPGVETMLPLLLAKVRAAELSLRTLQAAACDRPARWLGVPHGRFSPGVRANVLVVDFRARTTIQARRLRSACGWSAFEGAEAIFPVDHYLAGHRIVEGGELVEGRRGHVVRPEYAPGQPFGVPSEPSERR